MTFILILLYHIDYVHELIRPLILYYLILILVLQVSGYTLARFLLYVFSRHQHRIELSIIFFHIFAKYSHPSRRLSLYLKFVELFLDVLD